MLLVMVLNSSVLTCAAICYSSSLMSASVFSFSALVFSTISSIRSREHLFSICSHLFMNSTSSRPNEGVFLRRRPRGIRFTKFASLILAGNLCGMSYLLVFLLSYCHIICHYPKKGKNDLKNNLKSTHLQAAFPLSSTQTPSFSHSTVKQTSAAGVTGVSGSGPGGGGLTVVVGAGGVGVKEGRGWVSVR